MRKEIDLLWRERQGVVFYYSLFKLYTYGLSEKQTLTPLWPINIATSVKDQNKLRSYLKDVRNQRD